MLTSGDITCKIDMFASGLILYNALIGDNPFCMAEDEMFEIVRKNILAKLDWDLKNFDNYNGKFIKTMKKMLRVRTKNRLNVEQAMETRM